MQVGRGWSLNPRTSLDALQHPQAKTAPDSIDLFLKFQGTDPLCIGLGIELSQNGSGSGHKDTSRLDQRVYYLIRKGV
jgi:hypothetical protein